MKRVTVQDVLSWNPTWPREEIERVAGNRKEFTAVDVLKEPGISPMAAIWVADRCGDLQEPARRRYLADCAQRVLDVFEKAHPDDKRPHRCLDAARAYAAEAIGEKELQHVGREAREIPEQTRAGQVAWAAICATSQPLTNAALELGLDLAQRASNHPQEEAAWQRAHYLEMLTPHAAYKKGKKTRKGKGKARNDVKVRRATNADAPRVQQLAEQSGFVFPFLDWTQIEPYWVVAEYDGEIIACAQFCPGKPIARLEVLSYDLNLSLTLRGLAIRNLYALSNAMARGVGAQAVSGMVPFRLKQYQNFLKGRGAVSTAQGHFMIRRI